MSTHVPPPPGPDPDDDSLPDRPARADDKDRDRGETKRWSRRKVVTWGAVAIVGVLTADAALDQLNERRAVDDDRGGAQTEGSGQNGLPSDSAETEGLSEEAVPLDIDKLEFFYYAEALNPENPDRNQGEVAVSDLDALTASYVARIIDRRDELERIGLEELAAELNTGVPPGSEAEELVVEGYLKVMAGRAQQVYDYEWREVGDLGNPEISGSLRPGGQALEDSGWSQIRSTRTMLEASQGNLGRDGDGRTSPEFVVGG